MLHFLGVSLSTCGRRDESLQIFSQACMFGAKLAGAGKEALPRVVLSAVLTGDIRIIFAATFVWLMECRSLELGLE